MVVTVTVEIVVVMVGVGRRSHESRSGLSWVHLLQLKGWAGVPTLHSDKISHLTSTLFTCLQIIKHNIAYMSAVGAEYADVYFAT